MNICSYQTLIEYSWKLVRELRGRSVSHFSMDSSRAKSMETLLELPGPIPLRLFIESSLHVNGNAIGACWANGFNINDIANSMAHRELTI